MTWAVLDDYSYTPVEVVRETKSTLIYKQWNQPRTKWIERKSLRALPWRGDEASANRLSAQLVSAKAERYRRITAANQWFAERVKELTSEQGDDS